MNPARVLLFDLETSPNIGYSWGKWEQNIIEYTQDWRILSVGWKWLGEGPVEVKGLCDFPGYKKDKLNDEHLVNLLWKLFNRADVIVAHNGRAFDSKKATARFIALGLPPPAPYKQVDTLKTARKFFKFDSNKLDDLGQYLKLGRKLPHTGFHLWKGCMGGDKKSWKMMKEYNKQDVILLEKIYLKFRGWDTGHPDMTLYHHVDKVECPVCLSQKTIRRGYAMLKKRIKQRFSCLNCNHWFSGNYVDRTQI